MSIPLDIIVVGAGIAGLSAAISLRRAGHHVWILERSSLGNEVGAAINVCPNASRVLLAWGLDPAANRFVEVQGILTAVGATLEPIINVPLGPWVRGVYGAPLYFAHRVDLHEALKKLATGEGPGKPALLQLDTTAVSYVSQAHHPLESEMAHSWKQGPRTTLCHSVQWLGPHSRSGHRRRWDSFHRGGDSSGTQKPSATTGAV